MSSKRRSELTDRQVRLEAIRTAQKRSERKRTILIAAIAGVLVLGLTGATITVIVRQGQHDASIQAAAKSPIAGVKT
ncbi:MAG: hypothetical protein ACYCTH_11755, partial [Cellulomonas sp.]